MKKFSFGKPFMALATLSVAFALAFAGCSGGGSEFDEEFNVTSADFDSTFENIHATPGHYLINLSGNLLDYQGIYMETAGVNITVRGTGANRITLKDVMSVVAGKLTLENIALSRGTGNSADILFYLKGGTVEIKNGVTISNNNGTDYFSGVFLDDNSVFIMSGGVIENCDFGIIGRGGNNSSITISGGIIRNNSTGIRLDNTTTVKVTGGTFENHQYGGIGTGAKGVTINISGGTFRNNLDNVYELIALWNDAANCTVNITGGEFIKSNGDYPSAVFIRGNGNHVTMSNGKITSDWVAVFFDETTATECSFTLSRGEVTGAVTGIMIGGSRNTVTVSGGSLKGTSEVGIFVWRGNGHTVTKTGGTVTGGNHPYYVGDSAQATVTGF